MGSIDGATVATYWRTGYLAGCAYIAATTLCAYDFLLSWDRERRCIWERKMSAASVLYLLNRYANICDNGFTMVQMVAWAGDDTRVANETCSVLFKLGAIASALIYLALALFAAIRTCAIWDQDKRVFGLVLCLGLVYPILSLCIHLKMVEYAAPYPARGCINSVTMPAAHDPSERVVSVMYRTRIGITIVLEMVILVLTWAKTAHSVHSINKECNGIVHSLSFVLWCNGILQFSVFLVPNVASLLQYLWPPIKFVVLISDSLTSVMFSHFILDLREEYVSRTDVRGDDRDRTFHLSDVSRIHFTASAS